MAFQYDLIFSLGSMPITANLLTALDLQLYDYPFDYVTGTDLKTRMNLFLTNFNGFLEKPENIVLAQDFEGQEASIYKDKVNGLEFPYDFNIDLPLENTFPQAKQKYNNLIRRLGLVLRRAKNILMIYVENPLYPEDEEANFDFIVESLNKLMEIYPNKVFNFLYIKNDEESQDLNMIKISQNAELLRFNFYRKLSDMSMPVVLPEVLVIAFAELKLKTTWRQKKILFIQKLLNKIIEFRIEHNI